MYKITIERSMQRDTNVGKGNRKYLRKRNKAAIYYKYLYNKIPFNSHTTAHFAGHSLVALTAFTSR